MHLEILVEDVSGKRTLELLLPKIIDNDLNTFRIHSYKGIGRIPKSMKDTDNAARRILLENVPKLLKGYGRTFRDYPTSTPAAVVLVCDLDDKQLATFLGELEQILDSCNPAPKTQFCIAIEEGEAWFLGDFAAIRAAYSNAKSEVLDAYVNDSICGTWEKLADAVYDGGEKALSSKGFQAIGLEKFNWAEKIPPFMNVEINKSPSFRYFRDSIRALVL